MADGIRAGYYCAHCARLNEWAAQRESDLEAELAAARDREKGLRRLCDSSVTGMLAVSAIRAALAPETHDEGEAV